MRMNKPLLFVIFVLVAIAQLGIPVSMIVRRELTLRNGVEYRFRTRPVDPYDAFRGRYVALGFENNSVIVTNTAFKPGQKVYVGLRTNELGFAEFESVAATPPASMDYLKTRVLYQSGETVMVDLPFDRYYMNEQEAPEAERAYNQAARDGKRDAYAVVKIRAGMPVIADLYVDEMSISEFLKMGAESDSQSEN